MSMADYVKKIIEDGGVRVSDSTVITGNYHPDYKGVSIGVKIGW